jgi:hypothetical protein
VLQSVLAAATRDLADATNSARWSDPTVLQMLGLVHKASWLRILRVAPWYRWGVRSPTVTAGAFTVASLDAGAADTLEKFHRIIAVGTTDGARLREARPDRYAIESSFEGAAPDYAWWREGTSVRVTPRTITGLRVIVNWHPQLVDRLSGPSVVVDFPDGFHMILAYRAAGLLLSKGATELDGTGAFGTIAADLENEMLSECRRHSIAPMDFAPYVDSAGDWW